jgi:UDP-2,3-diacylglucosamine hydrolase
MGSRIGIVAGSGRFPGRAVEEALKRGLDCAVVSVSGAPSKDFPVSKDVFLAAGPGDLEKITSFFRDRDITDILLAGKVDPATLLDPAALDREARTLFASLGSERGPEVVLQVLIEYLARQGLRVIDPRPFLEPHFCGPGVLTAATPSPRILRDMEFGWTRARTLSDLDVGQTLVVRQGMVIAVEGLEGTDKTLERAGKLAGPGIVAVKVGRTRQDPRIDLPAVGLETVRILIDVHGAALCFEAKTVPFFDREEAVRLADEAGLAIVAR